MILAVENSFYRYFKIILGSLILSIVLFSNARSQTAEKQLYEPPGIFLTWQHDPATTITIDWHTVTYAEHEPALHYRKLGREAWFDVPVEGFLHGLSFSDRLIRRIELRNLDPETVYEFRFGEHSRVYSFKTMPDKLTKPLRFAIGGDVFGLEGDFERMNNVVMEYDPQFIVWGGDLNHANADPIRVSRLYEFFYYIKNSLIHENGRVVPIIVAIGNHELWYTQRLIWGRWPHHEHTEKEAKTYVQKYNMWDGKATWFFDLFAFPGKPSYNVLDFGDYMSLLVLDSNHSSPVVGGQTGWLKAILAERIDRLHLFPVYHVPAYPSAPINAFEGTTNTQIREHWVPLFEEYGVRVAFENHRHRYKRTHPIKDGKIAEDGIVYLGDGAWGIHNLRQLSQDDPWYIKKAASENNVIIVTLEGIKQKFEVINIDGQVIDTYSN